MTQQLPKYMSGVGFFICLFFFQKVCIPVNSKYWRLKAVLMCCPSQLLWVRNSQAVRLGTSSWRSLLRCSQKVSSGALSSDGWLGREHPLSRGFTCTAGSWCCLLADGLGSSPAGLSVLRAWQLAFPAQNKAEDPRRSSTAFYDEPWKSPTSSYITCYG